MFELMRVLIKKGASLDYVYSGITPLCAALTCGKKRAGDVRVVRLLLEAKADISMKTLAPRPSNPTRKLTHLEIAKEYSNTNCIRLISATTSKEGSRRVNYPIMISRGNDKKSQYYALRL